MLCNSGLMLCDSATQDLKILRIMNSFNCYIHFNCYICSAGSGWIQGAGFGKLCNSSTASGEGTPELYSSKLWITLFLVIS